MFLHKSYGVGPQIVQTHDVTKATLIVYHTDADADASLLAASVHMQCRATQLSVMQCSTAKLSPATSYTCLATLKACK